MSFDGFIAACGLPRAGGQSLQQALAILTGRRIWHSVGRDLSVIQPEDGGMAECWFPPEFIQMRWPDAKIIFNYRELDPWLKSCEKVYHKSAEWNNPLWTLPFECFRHYYTSYFVERAAVYEDEWLLHDFTRKPSWQPLCDFLGLPVPNVPFPNLDRVARPQTLTPVLPDDASDFRPDFLLSL